MEEADFMRIIIEMQNIIMKLEMKVSDLSDKVNQLETEQEETAMDEAAVKLFEEMRTPIEIHHNLNKSQGPGNEPDVAHMYQ